MSIRNKLIIYTIVSIFLTLIVVGISIDRIIINLYNNNSTNELNHSYSTFSDKLKNIENDILNQALLIASDNNIISTSNLINRYQNKNNYQTLLFNNEKKKIATFLLKHITLTKAEQAIIYSKNGDLLAYAIHNFKNEESGFISYDKGKPFIIRFSKERAQWLPAELPDSIQLRIEPVNNKISLLNHTGKTKYLVTKNEFIIENNKLISRVSKSGKISLLGMIKINTSLNTAFFKEYYGDKHAEISILLHNGYLINQVDNLLPISDIKQKSRLHGSISPNKKTQVKNNYYFQSYVWPTDGGNNYILITSSRSELVTALNKTRKVIVVSFSITALLAILFGIYWLNKLISNPLKVLAEQTKSSNDGNYPNFPASEHKDEISQLGKVLNEMVEVIKSREKELIKGTYRLENAQRLAKIGDWEIDLTTNKMKWSDEMYKIMDYPADNFSPSSEAIVKRTHPDDVAYAQNVFNESIKKHTPFDISHRIITEDNKTRYITAHAETFYDSNGQAIYSAGTIQDITEQTNNDEQLRRTQKMNAMGKLTGGIAHDFNNMLGVILGYAELLETSKSHTEKDKKYLDEIIHAAQRSSKLTTKLLSFSRQDTLVSVVTDINELLNNEQHMLEKTLTARITLFFELEKDLWKVLLDQDELEDAIINISINAMHAMPAGGKFTLSTKNHHFNDADLQEKEIELSAGDYVELSMIDTGTGMSQETIQRIFEPFYTTKKEKGTGLGMSQVYGFIQRSKGVIHIDSEIDKGTKIFIYFPRYTGKIKPPSLRPEIEPKNNHLSCVATILVVDDEESLLLLNKEILSEHGYKVLTANSGAKALEILKTETIELLLSDIIMPDMDGYELAAIINNKYPEVKIQMLSGFSNEPPDDKLSKKLYDNLLKKPFFSDELLKCIKNLLLEDQQLHNVSLLNK